METIDCSGSCSIFDVNARGLCSAHRAESNRRDSREGIVVVGKTRVYKSEITAFGSHLSRR